MSTSCRILILVVASVVLGVAGVPAQAAIRYVNAARPDDSGDGLSWAAAEKTLQAALAAAVSGDQIWVRAGTYKPDQGGGQTPGNRSASFQLISGVGIYGGFAGTETLLSQRNPAVNITILNGDLAGNDSPVVCGMDFQCAGFGEKCLDGTCNVPNNNGENSLHVVKGNFVSATAILDGFTITAGNANGSFPNNQGGGMYNDSGSPTVNNCTFTRNASVLSSAGMYNFSSSATVTNCTFSGNSAGIGGGGGPGGGGMLNTSGSTVAVTNCTFRGNWTKGGGGGEGGGLHYSVNSNGTVTNCTFLANGGFNGGGMAISGSSSATLTNCAFSGNSATSGDGGGLFIGGSGNQVLTNCTFSGNSAADTGGGIHDNGANTTLTNCILWGNSHAQLFSQFGTPVVNYSIVMGGWSGAGGTGNSTSDPLFIDANGPDNVYGTLDDDLRPAIGSPANDAGNTSALPVDTADLDGDADTAEQLPLDLALNPRRTDDLFASDTGVGPAPVVDMGAYEVEAGALSKVHVDGGATGADNGSSWTDAFTHLQSALNYASTHPEIIEIWVADGVYMPDGGRTPTGGAHVNGTGDRAATFQLRDNLSIHGGFAGTETMLWPRDVAANPTILSGDLTANDAPVACTQESPDCDFFGGICAGGSCILPDNNDENSYHVTTGSGTASSAVLNGFTIAGGRPTDGPSPQAGGGMVNFEGSPTVVNCTFVDNESGAMFNVLGSAVVRNSVFQRNERAMINNANGHAQVINCLFSDNGTWLGGAGGAMSNSQSSPSIVNCTFSRNKARFEGGGIHNDNSSSPTMMNSIFWGNVDDADGNAGGPFMDESAQIHTASGTPTVNYSIVQGGWTGAGGTGNLDADPLFADADLRLQAGSPAMDTGNDMGTTAPDLDGNPRIWDGDGDGNATVDMGAYEFSPDCNLNGVQDAADIASGTSEDGNENGIPDECSPFTDGCAPNRAWTCPNNWDLSGQYPDDVDSAVGISVNLPSGAVVELNETVVIPSLWIQDGGELQMTTHDTILDVDRAILVNGTLTMESCRLAGNTPPTLTIGPGGKFETALCTSEGDPSTMVAAEIRVLGPSCPFPPPICPSGPGGRVELEESISFTSTGNFIIDGSMVAPLGNVSGVTEPPALSIFDNATVTVAAALTVTGVVESINESSAGVFLQGDWDHQSISPSLFDWTAGRLTLDGSVPQNFEVSGIDLGPTLEGYDTDADALFDTARHKNFSIGTLEVAAGRIVEFRNDFANTVATGACEEAFYVDTLILRAGAVIALNDVNVYSRILINEGATITPVGCGDLLPVALPNDIVWDPTLNPIPWPNNNPLATTRSLRFTVTGPVGPSKLEAIKVTMVDLQHPNPPNLPAQAPPNFTTFDTRLNGVCVGGTLNGHHCDTTADCTSPGTCTGGLAACTADPACANAAECTLPSNGCARWVGKPGTFLEDQDSPAGATYRSSRLQCTPFYYDWKPEGLITAAGAEILPSSEYSVEVYGTSCMGAEAGCTAVSAPVTMYTRRSGDAGPNFNPPATTQQPDGLDVAQVVTKVKNLPGALVKAITQLQPNLVEFNANVNALDIVAVVDAVRQVKYGFSGPCACPSLVTCGALACPGGVGVCVSAHGAGALCMKTCVGGANIGDPCINNSHCPSSTCGTGFCHDRCGRCKP